MQIPYLLIFSGLWRREKYYHTDHLGSATLITDDAADVVQQIAYLPYGEDWVDIRNNGYFGSAYKFNGKEKDDETGYSYYGARYYTDRLSIWLSVDPLADKYPHLSPYAYCADNPVMLVDPDGRDIEPGSLNEWNNNKSNIIKEKDKLAKIKNPTADQIDRLNSLRNTLTTMDDMENSSQMYAVKNIGGNIGNISLEENTISINYTGKTANFVHELTHAGQFECNNEAFSKVSGTILTNDIYDEVAAYKAQYAYSPSSVYNLTSIREGGTSFLSITDKDGYGD